MRNYINYLLLFTAVLFLLRPHSVRADVQTFEVHVINVGYGDAIFIQFPAGSNMLIDSGGAEFSAELKEYLTALGVTRIDVAIITHGHKNHFGGLEALFERFSIGRIFVNGDTKADNGYDELITQITEKGVPADGLRKGDVISLPGADVAVLHPYELGADINENSIAIGLKYGETPFLFTADTSVAVLAEILAEFPLLAQTKVVQVPHHGREIGAEFKGLFKDKLFFVSTGPNEFGEIDEEALGSLRGTLFRTDRDGTIIFRSDGKEITVSHE